MSPATTDAIRIATYTLTNGAERALYGMRTGTAYMLTDTPLADDTDAREYLVERDIPDLDELRAIVDDYLDQAQAADVPPADIRRVYPDPSAVAS
jgi:hypothetical protein